LVEFGGWVSWLNLVEFSWGEFGWLGELNWVNLNLVELGEFGEF
jgi:hypothetical protein